MTGARAGRAIEHRKYVIRDAEVITEGRRQHPSHRYGEGGLESRGVEEPRHARTHGTGTWEVSMPSRCRGRDR